MPGRGGAIASVILNCQLMVEGTFPYFIIALVDVLPSHQSILIESVIRELFNEIPPVFLLNFS